MTRTRPTLIALFAVACTAAVAVQAQDETEEPAKPAPTSDLLDRELLKELVPELPLEAPEDERKTNVPLPDELDHAVTSMRDVTERLDRKDVSEETSRLQTSILADIDKLIDKLKSQPPQQDQNSNPDQSDQNSQNRENQPNSPNNRPQQQSGNPQPKPQAGDSPSPQPQAGKSEESSEQNQRESRERAAAALARRRALINEVWGHLPPAFRERLLNVQSEKLLPGYEALIRRYYESLAETEDNR